MDNLLKKTIGSGEPTKLVVGGLHGREGRFTKKILEKASDVVIKRGRTVLCNVSEKGKYISTLKLAYYQTDNGKRLLLLIREYNPKVYIELHSYNPRSYPNLTNPNRRSKVGVPPLVELENGILIGSVSPYLRKNEFDSDDLCLTIETSSDLKYSDVTANILKMILMSNTKHEILQDLRRKYPESIREAEEIFCEFYKYLNPF